MEPRPSHIPFTSASPRAWSAAKHLSSIARLSPAPAIEARKSTAAPAPTIPS